MKNENGHKKKCPISTFIKILFFRKKKKFEKNYKIIKNIHYHICRQF